MKICFLLDLVVHQKFTEAQLCGGIVLSARDTALKQLVMVLAPRSLRFSKGDRKPTNM